MLTIATAQGKLQALLDHVLSDTEIVAYHDGIRACLDALQAEGHSPSQ